MKELIQDTPPTGTTAKSDKDPAACRASDNDTATLPRYARLPINRCNVPAVILGYGEFINAIIQFVIVAFAIFMAIKLINRLNRKKEEPAAAPPAPTKEEVLLTEIRDLLKEQNNRV